MNAPRLVLIAAVFIGCGGGGGVTPPPPPPPVQPVFSGLLLSPIDVVMCLVDPGNTIVLSAIPRDQSGQPMTNLGSPLFTSSDAGAATVGANGMVRAIAAGSTLITATLTATGTTHTASASITVASAIAGDATGSVLENHPLPHTGLITTSQLSAGNALTLDIRGQAFHSHTLSLTGTQVRLIAAGCRISQVSSMATHSDGSGLHNHSVTFN
jgi:hypothetical protein